MDEVKNPIAEVEALRSELGLPEAKRLALVQRCHDYSQPKRFPLRVGVKPKRFVRNSSGLELKRFPL